MGGWILVAVMLLSANVSHTPTGLVAELDARETELEGLYADYWRTEYKIAMGDETHSTRPTQERIRKVVTDATFLQRLKKANFSESLLKRRRALFLDEAVYTKITNDPALTALVEKITRQENEFRYRVGDRRLTRAELSDLLSHSSNRRLREQGWRATSQIAAVNGARLQDAIRLRNSLAVESSNELFSTFMLRRKGVETKKLFEWFETIRNETEPEYQQLLNRMRSELGIDRVEPWDLEYYFSTYTSDFETDKVPTDDGWAKVKRLTASLGYDMDSVEMHSADLSFAGAAYPVLYSKEVKILANRYTGIYFYDRLLHATGHALHYQMIDEPSFLLRNDYPEPADEGDAQVLSLMLYRPEVSTKLFGLTPLQASRLQASYRLKMLFNLRNTMADSLSEFEAYADPDQDPATIFNRNHAKYLGVEMGDTPVWAFNPMYGSDPFYLQSFVVGEMVAHQIEHRTDERFGRNWGKATGQFLTQHFYSHGAGLTLDGMMKKGTKEPLTPRYLIQFLRDDAKPVARRQ